MILAETHFVKRVEGPRARQTVARAQNINNKAKYFATYHVKKDSDTYDVDVYVEYRLDNSRRSILVALNDNGYDTYDLGSGFPDKSSDCGSRWIAAAFAKNDLLNEWWPFIIKNNL